MRVFSDVVKASAVHSISFIRDNILISFVAAPLTLFISSLYATRWLWHVLLFLGQAIFTSSARNILSVCLRRWSAPFCKQDLSQLSPRSFSSSERLWTGGLGKGSNAIFFHLFFKKSICWRTTSEQKFCTELSVSLSWKNQARWASRTKDSYWGVGNTIKVRRFTHLLVFRRLWHCLGNWSGVFSLVLILFFDISKCYITLTLRKDLLSSVFVVVLSHNMGKQHARYLCKHVLL